MKTTISFACGFGIACYIWSIMVADYIPKDQCPIAQLGQELFSSSLDLSNKKLLCFYQNNLHVSPVKPLNKRKVSI